MRTSTVDELHQEKKECVQQENITLRSFRYCSCSPKAAHIAVQESIIKRMPFSYNREGGPLKRHTFERQAEMKKSNVSIAVYNINHPTFLVTVPALIISVIEQTLK